MTETFGQIICKSGTYAVAVLAARALSFLLIPFYTRFLTTADYGVLELLDLTVNFVIVFAGLRLGQALFYFYFAETDDDLRQRHMSTNVVASAGIGAIICLLFWLLAAPLSRFVFGTPQYAPLFRLTAVTVGLSIPAETFLCCLRTFNEPGAYAAISVAQTIFQGILNIVLLGKYHMGVSAMLWSGIVSKGIVVAALAVHVFGRVPLAFDMTSFRKQTRYTIPLSVGAMGEIILNYGDRYFLRKAVSLSEIGIYSLAYKIGMLIPLVQYPFQLYWGSQEVKIVRQEGGWRTFTRVATYFTLGLTATGVLLAIFIDPSCDVMVHPSFRAAGKYAVWIALAYLVRAVGGFFREIFVIEKRPDLDARVTWLRYRALSLLCHPHSSLRRVGSGHLYAGQLYRGGRVFVLAGATSPAGRLRIRTPAEGGPVRRYRGGGLLRVTAGFVLWPARVRNLHDHFVRSLAAPQRILV